MAVSFTFTELEELAGKLLPDFPRPYVILVSQGATVGPLPSYVGCTSNLLDLEFKSQLESQKRWRDRAPAMILDDLRLARGSRDEADARSQVGGIVAHEAAHISINRPNLAPMPAEVAKREAIRPVESYISSKISEFKLPPFYAHGGRFIRLALHLASRASNFGFQIEPNDVFSGASYHLPDADAFAAALGDEPERLASEPIGDVLSFDPPDNFTNFWRQSVACWEAANGDELTSQCERYLDAAYEMESLGD